MKKFWMVAVSVGVLATAAEASAQCTSTSECAAGQVCLAGICQSSAPPPAPASPTSVASASPTSVAPASPTVVPAAAPYGPWTNTAPPTPAATHDRETRGIKGFLIAGPIVFGVAYLGAIGITAGISSATGSNQVGKNTAYAAIPLVGPLVQLADPDRDTEDYAAPLVADSVLQFAGLTMFILGLSIRTEVPAETVRGLGLDTVAVEMVPVVGRDHAGAGASLTW